LERGTEGDRFLKIKARNNLVFTFELLLKADYNDIEVMESFSPLKYANE